MKSVTVLRCTLNSAGKEALCVDFYKVGEKSIKVHIKGEEHVNYLSKSGKTTRADA